MSRAARFYRRLFCSPGTRAAIDEPLEDRRYAALRVETISVCLLENSRETQF